MASDAPSPGEQRAPAEPAPAAPAARQAEAAVRAAIDLGALRPEEFTAANVPTVIRGYDRRRVEWLLLRASEAYAYVVRQRDAARERVRSLEAEVAAAEGEARVSAASVAELTQRVASAEEAARRALQARDEAAARLAAAEGGQAQALTDLHAANDRAAALGARVQELEEADSRRDEVAHEAVADVEPVTSPPDAEAASLLVAAVRAAEELRQSSRARALATLKRARERAASVEAEVEREQGALAEAQDRRRDAERVAGELLEQARAEAERVAAERREAERLAAEVGDERRRMQTFLAGALSALEPSGGDSEGLLADLSSRLPEAGERDDALTPRPDAERGD